MRSPGNSVNYEQQSLLYSIKTIKLKNNAMAKQSMNLNLKNH